MIFRHSKSFLSLVYIIHAHFLKKITVMTYVVHEGRFRGDFFGIVRHNNHYCPITLFSMRTVAK